MTDEPLTDAATARILADSIKLADDCCGNDAWRGRLCPYHSGLRDGLELAQEFLRGYAANA